MAPMRTLANISRMATGRRRTRFRRVAANEILIRPTDQPF
jgi:hypothetical protein